MKNFLKSLLVLVIVGAIGYFLYQFSAPPCTKPLHYSIGRFDNDFGISEAQFKTYVENASSVWEKALEKKVFVYDPKAEFKINLIYDERQLETMQKQKDESGLAAIESTLKKLDAQIDSAKTAYDQKMTAQKKVISDFEKRQNAYEESVNYWNAQGGAPKKEYDRLQAELFSLNAQARAINQETAELQQEANSLNEMIKNRNAAALQYNKTAELYNEKYSHGLEFDQAEYTGTAINVYQFISQKDLGLALAHELGHALGMNHVENPKSIMYYITTGNSAANPTPSAEDLAELNRVCKSRFSIEKFLPKIK